MLTTHWHAWPPVDFGQKDSKQSTYRLERAQHRSVCVCVRVKGTHTHRLRAKTRLTASTFMRHGMQGRRAALGAVAAAGLMPEASCSSNAQTGALSRLLRYDPRGGVMPQKM
eukprot:6474833-Amphidinium_carterae.1